MSRNTYELPADLKQNLLAYMKSRPYDEIKPHEVTIAQLETLVGTVDAAENPGNVSYEISESLRGDILGYLGTRPIMEAIGGFNALLQLKIKNVIADENDSPQDPPNPEDNGPKEPKTPIKPVEAVKTPKK